MLIILSDAVAVKDEAQLINNLFDAGLKIFHLRKPDVEQKAIEMLLAAIDSKYHAQIALHQYHQMAKNFGINRLHFTEAIRTQTSNNILIDLEDNGNILSTSIHQVSAYAQLPPCFNYTFFGPVFNSISKQGYISNVGTNFKMPILKNHPKAIAVGGITAANLSDALNMNFKGVGVLGSIWQQPVQSLEQFKSFQIAWNQTGQ